MCTGRRSRWRFFTKEDIVQRHRAPNFGEG
jgi:hypothetical protein